MKRCVKFLSIIMMLIQTPLYGQTDDEAILKILDRYDGAEGVESITISPSLLTMMVGSKAQDAKTKELTAKILELRIISVTITDADNESAQIVAKKQKMRDALLGDVTAITNKAYSQIMRINSNGERFELYLSKNVAGSDKTPRSLVMLNVQKKDLTVMYIAGTIDNELLDAVSKGEIGLTK